MRIRSKNEKSRRKSGMTLVEIILAMAILGIVVILLTPVMLSAFQMITLSGDRHDVAKGVAGNMEQALGGQPVTETLGDVQIDLPGGISVNGKKFEINDGAGAYYVDLNGYSINSMPIVTATGTISPTSGTSSTETSSTETSGTETTESTSPPTTTTPTEAPIELGSVNVNVANWKTTNKTGSIVNTTNKMEYMVASDDYSSELQGWTTCSNGTTYITCFSDNTVGYKVVVRQILNQTNNKHINVRAAPEVAFHDDGGKTYFYVHDTVWRKISDADKIEIILTPSDTWTLITSKTKVNNLNDRTYVYARRIAGIDDPPSFPYKVSIAV